MLANLQSDIAKAITKRAYINHYILNYGFIPLWVLVNTLTLGRLSQFYSLMNQSVRIEVSKNWNIKEEDLNQYIKTLAYYRNLCAHDERLYNSKNNQDIPDTKYHEILKILLPPDDFNILCNKINGRMESLKKRIIHINYDEILRKMGFPKNWVTIKKA